MYVLYVRKKGLISVRVCKPHYFSPDLKSKLNEYNYVPRKKTIKNAALFLGI